MTKLTRDSNLSTIQRLNKDPSFLQTTINEILYLDSVNDLEVAQKLLTDVAKSKAGYDTLINALIKVTINE